jgi:hypothetical protein
VCYKTLLAAMYKIIEIPDFYVTVDSTAENSLLVCLKAPNSALVTPEKLRREQNKKFH